MKKRLDVAELEIGMYVAELDRPWLETPFLFQGFELSNEEELEEIRRYCQYVYIDTEQSRVLPKTAKEDKKEDKKRIRRKSSKPQVKEIDFSKIELPVLEEL